jgi:lantibiotic modifying enzyme
MINSTMKKAVEHRQIVKWYNSMCPESHELEMLPMQSSGKIHQELDVNSINRIAVVLSELLNLSGGSVGTIDLYKLLQAYILDPKKREEINKITRGF